MVRIFLKWLPFAVVTTGMCLLVYGAVQQNFRQSLNDPQIQLAEDSAKTVVRDGSAVFLENWDRIDIGESLAPWVGVYDANGSPTVSSGVLHGELPKPPKGVFDAARENQGKDTSRVGQNRATWQPYEGVRQALVIQYFSDNGGGFIVAGRNMREVEVREVRLHNQMFIAWVVTLALSFAAVWLSERKRFA